jgi:hypothetical protein
MSSYLASRNESTALRLSTSSKRGSIRRTAVRPFPKGRLARLLHGVTGSTLNEIEEDQVSAVRRLVTFVDLAEEVGDNRQMTFSARHEAVLVDGRRVLLLDDRGWTWSSLIAVQADASDRDSTREQPPDIWATTSVEDIEQTARMVVGPDEPSDGFSQEDAEQGHWAYLSDVLRQHGVVADALDLTRLPHDVVLSDRLLARVDRSATGA